MANQPQRRRGDSVHIDLHQLRAGSSNLRMDVNSEARLALIGVLRQVMSETGTSQKALAATANVSEQILSDALAPHGTRHFAAAWILAQDNAFIAAYNRKVELVRGLTVESRREVRVNRITELMRLLLESEVA